MWVDAGGGVEGHERRALWLSTLALEGHGRGWGWYAARRALGMWTVRGWRAKNDAERGRRSRFAGDCRRGAREHSRGTAAPGAGGTSQAGRGDVGGSGVGGGGSASRFAGTVGAAESPSLSFAVAASGSFGIWGCGDAGGCRVGCCGSGKVDWWGLYVAVVSCVVSACYGYWLTKQFWQFWIFGLYQRCRSCWREGREL